MRFRNVWLAWMLMLSSLDAAELGFETEDCVGLVLGGGGARGAAHIGVLKVLERERVPVCWVAGTSMGAIVGGYYAAGYRAEEIERIIRAVDWRDVFNDDPPRSDISIRRKQDALTFPVDSEAGFGPDGLRLPRGLIQGQKLSLLLRRDLSGIEYGGDFDRLPIPFRAVATDLVNGQAVVLDRGELAQAVRASMSVPAVFQPLRVNGHLLVDGGVSDNVPVQVVRAMGATRLIVVDVGAGYLKEAELTSPVAVSLQVITALMQRQTNVSLASLSAADVLIQPQLGDIGSASFDRAADAIPLGEAAAVAQLQEIRRYSVDAPRYAAWARAHEPRPAPLTRVDFLRVSDARSQTAGLVERRLAHLVGQAFDAATLEHEIGRIYGDGRYERIVWSPLHEGGRQGLSIVPIDKGWGPNFLRVAFTFDDNLEGRSGYQLSTDFSVTGLNRYGGEWRTRIDLGRQTGLGSEFFQPLGEKGQYYLAPFAGFDTRNQLLRANRQAIAEYQVERYRLGVEAGWDPDPHWRLYGGAAVGRNWIGRRVGSNEVPAALGADYSRAYLGLVRDTLDSSDFPSAGSRVSMRHSFFLPAFGNADDGQVLGLTWDHALSRGRGTWLYGLRIHSATERNQSLEELGFLGGLANLSGFGDRDLVGDQAVLGRLINYWRLDDASKLATVPIYAGFSIETGNVWDGVEAVSLDSLILAGSVFVGVDTFLGPLFFGYGRNSDDADSLYLSFRPFIRRVEE